MKAVVWDVMLEAVEPARAVLPLALYLVMFTWLAQREAGLPENPVFKPEMWWGMPCLVLGLAIFKRGLRKGLMPLGEQLGHQLPYRMPQTGVCVICFLLAIGLTFAEPAIGALQDAATLLDPHHHKLLAAIFGDKACTFLLVLAIGVGVGIAAVVGSLRLMHSWRIKPMIYWTLLPCLVCSLLCSLSSEQLETTVGLAWDAGAVTTGPVTVPVVLSLGIGLAQFAHSPRRKRVSKEAWEGKPASQQALLQQVGDDAPQQDSLEGFGIVTFASLWPVLGVLSLSFGLQAEGIPDAYENHLDSLPSMKTKEAPDAHTPGVPEITMTTESLVPLFVGLFLLQRLVIRERIPNGVPSGLVCVYIGLTLFNVGLNFGLLPLGNAAGEEMASSFKALMDQDRFCYGTLLICCFAFVGTFAAQVAEPALAVLGDTVQDLTDGAFPSQMLVYVVAAGAATGTCVGMIKVLFDAAIWKILLPVYFVAIVLTYFSQEGITCVAWDAGGVTTGSVTVPLILALGLGLGKRVNNGVSDGFGLLGCASAFPIVTVLLAGLVLDRRKRRAMRLEQVAVR